MSLITPDFGLLFWMVIIFGIVFFLLAKFGFPIISKGVESRSAKIEKSLKDADEIEARMAAWKADEARMMEEVRKQQAVILKEAAQTRDRIIADAREEAHLQAGKILESARKEIEAEKESALRDIRKEVALIGVSVAEKVLRKELSDETTSAAYLDSIVDEAARAQQIQS